MYKQNLDTGLITGKSFHAFRKLRQNQLWVVECLPSMEEVLGLTPRTAKKKKKS
jgi:hypothetical protein